MRIQSDPRFVILFLLGVLFAASLALAGPLAAPVAATDDDALDDVKSLLRRFDRLPDGWRLKHHFRVYPSGFAALEQKIGADLVTVTNNQVQTPYGVIKANLIVAASDADAATTYRAMLGMRQGNRLAVKRDGTTIVEFVADDARAVREAAVMLGFEPRESTYRVKFDLAALRSGNAADVNVAFNLLAHLSAHPQNGDVRKQIESYRDQFEFGRSINLRLLAADGRQGDWSVSPAPERQRRLFHNDVVSFEFGEMPEQVGIPYATVEGTVQTRAYAITPSDRIADVGLTAATPTWPSENPDVRSLAATIVGDAKTVSEKVERLLAWHVPGKNMTFGGEDKGSRHGVMVFHDRKLGHCWDFSDSFVTLARAVDVPCRQVGGWVDDMGGHVWAEVLHEGTGWQQVDPTANGGCDASYVPLFTTEDGAMPILYLEIPTLEKL